ncbi:MAG: AI-2E family transporter [Alphaproteobacteria bacterium]|nr:AI-2E family transporter [Alphaproteobacteria bacterium]
MNQHVQRPGRSERTHYGLTLTDAHPLAGLPAVWRLAALVSTVAMGMLALIGALYLGRSILLPVTAGLIVGITLSPLVQLGTRVKIPQPVSALIVFALLVAFLGLLVTFFAAPLTEWIGRAPEIGRVVQEKLHAFDYPLTVLRELRKAVMPATVGEPTVSVAANPAEVVGNVLLAITPAVSQFVLFFGTLVFFLATNSRIRQKLIIAFWTREARLRMIRIWNDIETNLVAYVGLVTLINIGLGAVTAAMLYAIGFPNPLTFGLLTMALNYVPYIGPAIVAIVLFGVGVVAMPSLGLAALAPALFVAIATAEGHFITPSIVGRRLTLNPFVVFLALAFWTWLWGPIGAFLAVPLLIVSFVTLGHLLPSDEGGLPD